jgi:hypothetical protein
MVYYNATDRLHILHTKTIEYFMHAIYTKTKVAISILLHCVLTFHYH